MTTRRDENHGLRDKPKSPEHRANISRALRGVPKPENHIANIATGMRYYHARRRVAEAVRSLP